jgi:hypothetical protein
MLWASSLDLFRNNDHNRVITGTDGDDCEVSVNRIRRHYQTGARASTGRFGIVWSGKPARSFGGRHEHKAACLATR